MTDTPCPHPSAGFEPADEYDWIFRDGAWALVHGPTGAVVFPDETPS